MRPLRKTMVLIALTLLFDAEIPPLAVAYWQGALFLGTDDAQVLKASAQ
jgi:hypothetical protein